MRTVSPIASARTDARGARALASADAAAAGALAAFAAALRHDQSCPAYNPNLRQLLHVGYKLAAEMGPRFIAALQQHFRDASGSGRRHVHRGLVGLQCDERRIDLDHVTGLHEHIDHVDVSEIADVGDREIEAHGTASRRLRGSAST